MAHKATNSAVGAGRIMSFKEKLLAATSVQADLVDSPEEGSSSTLHQDETMADANTPIATWPKGGIPEEVIELIARSLSRDDHKALRLVYSELYHKISPRFFRNVVVPFRSEEYWFGSRRNPAVTLFSDKRIIFDRYGPNIRRFALSLELNEDDLAFPPHKCALRAIPTYWGVYAWPHEHYGRFRDLEGLETIADKLKMMKEVLGYLPNITDLGLCCDPGLGFLCGPDTNARLSTRSQPVFASQYRKYEQYGSSSVDPRSGGVPAENSGAALQSKTDFSSLRPMLVSAGFERADLQRAYDVLMETQGTAPWKLPLITASRQPLSRVMIEAEIQRRSQESLYHMTRQDYMDLDYELSTKKIEADDVEASEVKATSQLLPLSLKPSQKEVLLELGWVHLAMAESFLLTVMDMGSAGQFEHLSTLNIAKIPSCHLDVLGRKDFWKALPTLNSVSLGVVADWRLIRKTKAIEIVDIPVSPVLAVRKAYSLLNDFIGRRKNIKTLHFEWICGGELAPGAYQRNHYLLPVPLMASAKDMCDPRIVVGQNPQGLLSLPHVKSFSLKNCYVTPHVWMVVVRQIYSTCLGELALESVSMTGPPTMDPQFVLAASTQDFAEQFALRPRDRAQFAQVPGNTVGNNLSLLIHDAYGIEYPREPTTWRWFSWASFLEYFSPGITQLQTMNFNSPRAAKLRQMRLGAFTSARGYLPDDWVLTPRDVKNRLKSITFKSCGYAYLDQRHIKSAHLLNGLIEGSMLPQKVTWRSADDESSISMQRSTDPCLGIVFPHLHLEEQAVLKRVYGMTFGWQGVYPQDQIDDASREGSTKAGVGRFSGTVKASR